MTKTINEQSNGTLQGQTLKILFAKCLEQFDEFYSRDWNRGGGF
jgi:hypothetical protein